MPSGGSLSSELILCGKHDGGFQSRHIRLGPGTVVLIRVAHKRKAKIEL